MGRKLNVVILTMGLVGTGCGPLYSTARTVVFEPLEYCETFDAAVEHVKDAHLAKEAWKNFECGYPKGTFSDDYACGYRDGYADLLFAGGPGRPPPLPPRHYFNAQYENPEGHKAIDEWYAGFAHGAADAQASGLRELVRVPTTSPPLRPRGTLPNPIISGPPSDFDQGPPMQGPPMQGPILTPEVVK
jgi:hypothetical protein